MSRTRPEPPSKGDSFHRESHSTAKNGIAIQINYKEEEVTVQYYGYKTTEDKQVYSFEDLKYTWTDRFGGVYFVY